MADVSKLVSGGVEYVIKDADARERIESLESYSDYLGVTTTELTDGATTNPVTINEESVTAVKGNIVNYGAKEFIYNGTAWQEFGDMSAIRALAFKDNASGNVTPEGTVSQPTFTGTSFTSSGTYTPEGTVSQPTAEVTPTTETIGQITGVGTLPSMTYDANTETLTFAAGSLPTTEDITVMTGASVSVSQPTFSGTQDTVEVTGTATGTVSQPTFSGTQATVTVS